MLIRTILFIFGYKIKYLQEITLMVICRTLPNQVIYGYYGSSLGSVLHIGCYLNCFPSYPAKQVYQIFLFFTYSMRGKGEVYQIIYGIIIGFVFSSIYIHETCYKNPETISNSAIHSTSSGCSGKNQTWVQYQFFVFFASCSW